MTVPPPRRAQRRSLTSIGPQGGVPGEVYSEPHPEPHGMASRARLARSVHPTAPSERPLTAISLPASEAADTVRRVWDVGGAVAVLDPNEPTAERDQRLAMVRPTEVVDSGGGRSFDGEPVAADVVAVAVTSGTTAAGKAVELTAEGMLAAATATHAVLGVEPDDRWLCCLPINHVAGLAIVARSWITGIPIETLDRFDVDTVAARAETCTLVSLVPTMLARLLDAHAPVDRFRRILIGGGPVPTDLIRRAHAVGASIVTTYGMSETWGGVIYDGVPLPGVAVDLDEDNEVLLDGPMVMRGYRADLEATSAAFTRDGWLRTGDLGTFRSDGRLTILDRKKDLIKTGGVSVHPSAVEDTLAGHPKVREVCVIGTPDSMWGEVVTAHVVPTDPDDPPSLAELKQYARTQLSNAELPRQLSIVRSIPRTETGKPMRRALVRVP